MLRQVQQLDPIDFVRFNEYLSRIVKRTGVANTQDHRTARTHFCGTLNDIAFIEETVFEKCFAEVIKTNKNQELFGIESRVKSKRVNVILPSKLYSYSIWFRYDERDGKATMEIADKDIWLLCKVDGEILEILGRLERKID